MNEINLEKIGAFISEKRRALGMTQKDLAEKLFLSDKAVSKWERGLSLPDVSVLMPLALVLGVTVTELLEGEEIKTEEPISVERTEQVVQKAISLSENPSARARRFHKKNLPVWLAMTIAAVVEFLLMMWLGCSAITLFSNLLTLQILGVLFAAYFWLFAPERLPSYYDENRMNVFVDGIFHMNMPGVYFNNRNWRHILHVCRIWSLLASVASAPVFFLLDLIPGKLQYISTLVALIFYLLGLFIPLAYVAKKYE